MDWIETEVGSLEEIFSPVDALADSCKLVFSESNIYIPIVHKTNSAIANIEVQNEYFSKYRFESKELAIQTHRLVEILEMSDNKETAKFVYDKNHYLQLEISDKIYKLGLIDPSSVAPQPDVQRKEKSISFSLEKNRVREVVRSCGIFSNELIIEAEESENQLKFRAKEDFDEVIIDHTSEFNFDQSISASFDQRFIDDITSVISPQTNIQFKISPSGPMKISYKMLNAKGSVEFLLAQRIGPN